MMHVVIRLNGAPLRVIRADGQMAALGYLTVGGARSVFYVRDISQPSRSVGAQLFPGASLPLVGLPAAEFADQHVALDAVWGPSASKLRERLIAATSPDAALDLFEASLAQRLPRVCGIDPIVAHAVTRFETPSSISAVVAETGYSHRHFITRFCQAVGLTPKRYCRVRRFNRMLALAATQRSWAELALDLGYSDQAHLSREFGELAGLSPVEFRRLSPAGSLHVPVATSNSFKTAPVSRSKIAP